MVRRSAPASSRCVGKTVHNVFLLMLAYMEERSASSGEVLPRACCVLLDLAVRLGSSLPKPRTSTSRSREALIETIGTEIVRFQDGSAAVDDAAAAVLALDRPALPCMTVLLYGGAASIEQLTAATGLARKAVLAMIQTIQLGIVQGN